LTLAENRGIKLTERALGILSDLAQGHDDLASPLLRRDEITPDIASRLYRFVGEELKHYILEHFEIDTDALIEVIDDVVLDFVESAENEDLHAFTPSDSLIKSANRFHEKGLLTVSMMIGTLKRSQSQAFVAQFARFTGLSPATVAEI